MRKSARTPAAAYFDAIASAWDSWEDLDSLKVRLDEGLRRFGVRGAERILDVGCGTGNLTAAILRRLSPAGSVTAVDVSGNMIAVARAKIADPRVRWIRGPVERIGAAGESYDRIICYSVWSHLTDPAKAAQLFRRLLRRSGRLHIWHLISRRKVNEIHAGAADAVRDHLLPPVRQTALLVQQAGFCVEETQDDKGGYLVSALKE